MKAAAALFFALTAALLLAPCTGHAAGSEPPGFHQMQTGEAAPDFALPGIDGKTWKLADFTADVLMVYFTSNHCPVCHAQDPRLMKLAAELKGRSFAIAAINPNSAEGLRADELGYSKYNDSFEEMKLYAKDEGFTFPYLYDGVDQKTAKAWGCLATPHVFILDKARKVRYQGWLDDSRFAAADTVKHPDARNAVLALLEGREPEVTVTKPFGCSTKWLEKKDAVARDDEKWATAPVSLELIDAKGIAALRANDTKKFRLFNVWSTTCVPCVEEFPALVAMSRRFGLREFELITISTDLPADLEKAKKFLEKKRAVLHDRLKPSLKAEGRAGNNYLYSEASQDDLVKALDPAWDGPQPHTVLVAPGGKTVWSHTGPVTAEELQAKILDAMGEVYVPDAGK